MESWIWKRSNRAQVLSRLLALPDGTVISARLPGRTARQNAMIWHIARSFAEQKQWRVNGELQWLSPEEWKDLLTASFRREIRRMADALDGPGVVLVGASTSNMSAEEANAFIDFCMAMATDLNITVQTDDAQGKP